MPSGGASGDTQVKSGVWVAMDGDKHKNVDARVGEPSKEDLEIPVPSWQLSSKCKTALKWEGTKTVRGLGCLHSSPAEIHSFL